MLGHAPGCEDPDIWVRMSSADFQAGRRRRRWSVDAAFGPAGTRAGRPRTTVTIDAATCERLGAMLVATRVAA